MTWSFVLARRNFRAPRIKAATTLSRMKKEQPTIRIPLRITEYSNFYVACVHNFPKKSKSFFQTGLYAPKCNVGFCCLAELLGMPGHDSKYEMSCRHVAKCGGRFLFRRLAR